MGLSNCESAIRTSHYEHSPGLKREGILRLETAQRTFSIMAAVGACAGTGSVRRFLIQQIPRSAAGRGAATKPRYSQLTYCPELRRAQAVSLQ